MRGKIMEIKDVRLNQELTYNPPPGCDLTKPVKVRVLAIGSGPHEINVEIIGTKQIYSVAAAWLVVDR
jgi:hypothetical protein